MAYHSIIISKIEWTLGYGAAESPDWWENHFGAVERSNDVDATNWVDCTRDGLPTIPDDAYTSNAAGTIWVPGTGWVYDTAGDTDTIASHALHLAAEYEETYGRTIFQAINYEPQGAIQHPAAVRVTVDVTTALSGPSDDLEANITHPDLYGEFYLVRVEGGPTTSVPALIPITATGTGADIGTYVHTFLIVPTGVEQYDMEGIDLY